MRRVGVFQIGELLQTKGESYVRSRIAQFSCLHNKDVDDFLRDDSIEFTNRMTSMTHVVIDAETQEWLAYFTLAHKPISIEAAILSGTQRRRMERFCRSLSDKGEFVVSAYLIAQLGKNGNVRECKPLKGDEIIEIALNQLREIQFKIGGQVVFLEMEKGNAKLTEFYHRNHFRAFDSRQSDEDGVVYELMFRFFK